ncbi:uncharacterized protein LOC124895158, partial [Capsicum annuum]|uniref:uncharacterized protein LOC124895158 n=1 Tax=Capsicum annuum TaxID=4072 RepID=UPI001FB12565
MASDPFTKPSGDHYSHDNRFRAKGAQSQAGGGQSAPSYPPYRFCEQMHHWFYEEGRNRCFKCVPAPKGATSTSGIGTRQNHLFVLVTRQDSESSFDVVTGMLRLFYRDVYCLLDPGSTPFVAVHFSSTR